MSIIGLKVAAQVSYLRNIWWLKVIFSPFSLIICINCFSNTTAVSHLSLLQLYAQWWCDCEYSIIWILEASLNLAKQSNRQLSIFNTCFSFREFSIDSISRVRPKKEICIMSKHCRKAFSYSRSFMSFSLALHKSSGMANKTRFAEIIPFTIFLRTEMLRKPGYDKKWIHYDNLNRKILWMQLISLTISTAKRHPCSCFQ